MTFPDLKSAGTALLLLLAAAFKAHAQSLAPEDIAGNWQLYAVEVPHAVYRVDADSVIYGPGTGEEEREELGPEIRARFGSKCTLNLTANGHYVVLMQGTSMAARYRFSAEGGNATITLSMPDNQQEETIRVSRTKTELVLAREDEDGPVTMIFRTLKR